jgi:hypothetical protein
MRAVTNAMAVFVNTNKANGSNIKALSNRFYWKLYEITAL